MKNSELTSIKVIVKNGFSLPSILSALAVMGLAVKFVLIMAALTVSLAAHGESVAPSLVQDWTQSAFTAKSTGSVHEITPWTTTLKYPAPIAPPYNYQYLTTYYLPDQQPHRCHRLYSSGTQNALIQPAYLGEFSIPNSNPDGSAIDCEVAEGAEILRPSGKDSNNYWGWSYQAIFSAHYIDANGFETSDAGKAKKLIALQHGENKTFGNQCSVDSLSSASIVSNGTISPSPRGWACFDGYHLQQCAANDPDPACQTYSVCPAQYKFKNTGETCNDGYNAFVSLGWRNVSSSDDNDPAARAPYNLQSMGNQTGPIAWPLYQKDGNYPGSRLDANAWQNLGHGARHPSSIIVGNQLYVFYWDHSNDGGYSPGFKVAKAQLKGSSSSSPVVGGYGGFSVYSQSGQWQPAIRFDPKSITGSSSVSSSHFGNDGSRGNPVSIFQYPGESYEEQQIDAANTLRFSVAKANLEGTPYVGNTLYIGVLTHGLAGIQVMVSKDLVHWSQHMTSGWSNRQPVYRIPNSSIPEASALGQSPRLNAIFLSDDGLSHTAIKPNSFYIVASTAQGAVGYYKLGFSDIGRLMDIANGAAALPSSNTSAASCGTSPHGSRVLATQFPSLSFPVGQKCLTAFCQNGHWTADSCYSKTPQSMCSDSKIVGWADYTTKRVCMARIKGGDIRYLNQSKYVTADTGGTGTARFICLDGKYLMDPSGAQLCY